MRGVRLANSILNIRRLSSSIETNEHSYVVSLLNGKNPYKYIYPYPKLKSNFDSLNLTTDTLKKFLKENNDPDTNDKNGYIDEYVLKFLKAFGVFGMQVPEKYHGLGLSSTEFARIIETFGSDMALGVTLGSHQSIGFKGILMYGNDQQKEKYLPKLASGETLAAFALTEPNAGSDVSSIESKAVLSEDHSHFILNGTKIWTSNADKASVFTVFAKTNVNGESRISAFIVEKSFPGVTVGHLENKMGLKSVHSVSVNFDNVKIPRENVLGEVGEGFKIAMGILNSGRFGMGALMCSVQRYLLTKALNGTKDRVQFGKNLVEFQDIQHKLACMAADLYTTEAITYLISDGMDKKLGIELEAAICKIFSSETTWNCADECIQLLGGMGYMVETGVERILRDLRVFRIFEGTNDILRQFIILTALRKSDPSFITSLRAIFSLRMMDIKASGFTSYTSELASVQKSFAIECFASLKGYKKNIVNEILDKQVLVRSLSNTVIHLYGAAAVLSRFASNTAPSEDEKKLFIVAFKRNIQNAKHFLSQTVSHLEYVGLVTDITSALIENNGCFTRHPTE